MSTIFLITRGVPAVYTYICELVIIASGSYGRFGYVCNYFENKKRFYWWKRTKNWRLKNIDNFQVF